MNFAASMGPAIRRFTSGGPSTAGMDKREARKLICPMKDGRLTVMYVRMWENRIVREDQFSEARV